MAAYTKSITPERDGRSIEYRAELDGQLVGYYRNYSDAERALDDLVLELLSQAADDAADLGAVAEQLEAEAQDEPQRRAIRKAAMEAAQGTRPVASGASYLVESRSRGGVVHRTDGQRCSCEAGQHGRPCWHAQIVRLVERAAHGAPTLAA